MVDDVYQRRRLLEQARWLAAELERAMPLPFVLLFGEGEAIHACFRCPPQEMAQYAAALLRAAAGDPSDRTCSSCGHRAAQGAGAGGDRCPLVGCPGSLR
jgi:hypothetical protein